MFFRLRELVFVALGSYVGGWLFVEGVLGYIVLEEADDCRDRGLGRVVFLVSFFLGFVRLCCFIWFFVL